MSVLAGGKDCIVAINTFCMIVDLFVYSFIQSTACSTGKHLTNKQANPAFSKLERMQSATSAKDTKHFWQQQCSAKSSVNTTHRPLWDFSAVHFSLGCKCHSLARETSRVRGRSCVSLEHLSLVLPPPSYFLQLFAIHNSCPRGLRVPLE